MRKAVTMLLLALILVGCSNGSSSQDSVLTVGMECAYPPFNWVQETETEYTVSVGNGMYCDGYDVAIAREIAEGLDMDLNIHVNPVFDALLLDVQNGTIDLIIAGMTDTEDRRQAIDFTDVYYYTDLVLMVRKDSPLATATSINDFSGYRVAAQTGTTHDALIDQISGVDHMLTVKNFPLLATQLANNAIDAFVSENVVAEAISISNPSLTYIRFEGDNGFQIDEDMSVSIGLAKDSPLKNRINDILAGISEEERTNMMNAAIERQP